MTFQFPTPSLTEISQHSPDKLIQLASQYPDVKISLPTVDKVLTADVENFGLTTAIAFRSFAFYYPKHH
ncbi:MAG: hypothetical protein ACHBN1_03915 [Heteroscytonema crispum UTEX LB 1556]